MVVLSICRNFIYKLKNNVKKVKTEGISHSKPVNSIIISTKYQFVVLAGLVIAKFEYDCSGDSPAYE